jgi:HEAT repeat protein
MQTFRYFLACVVVFGGAAMCRSETPRTAEELRKTFDELLPKMNGDAWGPAADPQQRWQDICLQLGAPGNEALRAEACRLMAAKLGPATPAPTRIWLLKQLERLGGGPCVDAVAAALSDGDATIREAARRALANIPATEAGDRLRTKLTSTSDGQIKIGLLTAMGYRAEPASVAVVARELGNSDAAVVVAAAKALGKIATPEAAQALTAARGKATGERRLWIDDSLLLVADKLLKAQHKGEAVAIYRELSKADEPRSIRVAALKGLVQAK